MGRRPQGSLTESIIKKLSNPSNKLVDYRDGNGLVLRISPIGKKVWRYEYRHHRQKRVLPLGPYPAISLKQARELRQEAESLRSRRIDPVVQAREDVIKEMQERQRQADILAREAASASFKTLVDEYIASLDGGVSQYGIMRALYKDAIPEWGDRRADSITRRECVLLLDKVKCRAPVGANRLCSYLRTTFKIGVQRGLIEHSPMNDVAKPVPRAEFRDNAKKALNQDQVKLLYQSLGDNILDDVIRVILWTGARPKEVLHMKWSQIHDDVWTLGFGEHKAGHKRARIISRPLISRVLTVISRYRGLHDQLVFQGRKQEAMKTPTLTHFVTRIRGRYGIEGFTPNRIRHTMSTQMRRLGVRPDIVERIIGHIVDAGIAEVYSSYDWLPEMRMGMERWHEWIESLVGESGESTQYGAAAGGEN